MTYILSLRPLNQFINWIGKISKNLLLDSVFLGRTFAGCTQDYWTCHCIWSSFYQRWAFGRKTRMPVTSPSLPTLCTHWHFADEVFPPSAGQYHTQLALPSPPYLLLFFLLTKCLTIFNTLSLLYYLLTVYCLSSLLEGNLHKQSWFVHWRTDASKESIRMLCTQQALNKFVGEMNK